MTNTIQEALLHHRSIRSYQDKPVPPAVLDAILDAAWRSPSSVNGQQISLVVVQDPKRRQKIAEIAGGQAWIAQAPVFIAIIMDFHKTQLGVEKAGGQQRIHHSVEGFAVGAVDAGIMLGRLLTATQAAGLGSVPIGGIRRDPQAMIDLLGLPKLTFPLVGLSLGYIDQDTPLKPRLPRESFIHHEQYDDRSLPDCINEYDQILKAYWEQLQRPDGLSWSENLALRYQSVYFPQVAPVSHAQGFTFDE